jgi:hypothetical protein
LAPDERDEERFGGIVAVDGDGTEWFVAHGHCEDNGDLECPDVGLTRGRTYRYDLQVARDGAIYETLGQPNGGDRVVVLKLPLGGGTWRPVCDPTPTNAIVVGGFQLLVAPESTEWIVGNDVYASGSNDNGHYQSLLGYEYRCEP